MCLCCSNLTGFGKTYTNITVLCHLLIKYPDTHAIILAPQKAVKAFKRELGEKLKVAYNTLTSAQPQMMKGARISIITHTSLKKYIPYINQLKEQGHRLLLLVDEAHCCSYDTLIQTNLGELKIGDIVTNQIKCKVVSYNESLNKIELKPIVQYFENECYEDMYEVSYMVKGKIKTVELTAGHPVYTKNRGYVCVEDLNENDIILSVSCHCDYCSEGKIVSIKKIKKPKMVYNIGVKDNNNYFANDLLVHNCLEEPHSKFYEQVASIRHLFSVCYFATATPLKNNIEGLYWLMYVLDPNILKDWYTFKNSFLVIERHPVTRYIGKGKKKYKKLVWEEEIVGYKNIDTLRSILDQYIIIKQKQYNLKFFYHKTNMLDTEVDPYLEAGQGLLRDTAKDSFAVRMHDLQMVVDNINEQYRVINKMSSKEMLFISLIREKMKGNHPTLIYCDYNEVVDRLEYLLKATQSKTGVKQILKVTGSISLKEREKVEELIDIGTVVLITSAGTESINLQKADSLVFYDIPFSILTFMQAVGRVTRIDSKYNEQYIHLLETVGTIDSYKRCLIQINGGLIMKMFGKMETLPLEAGQIDRNVTRQLKQGLLWCFKQGRLLEEEELQKILKEGKIE